MAMAAQVETDTKKMNQNLQIPEMHWTKDMSLVLSDYSSLNDFIMVQTNGCMKFALFEKGIGDFYKNEEKQVIGFNNLVVGGIYAGFLRKNDTWGRIQVKELPTSEFGEIVAIAIDHGYSVKFRAHTIMELKAEFFAFPRRSAQCCVPLFGYVRPKYVETMHSIMRTNIGEKFHVESTGFVDGVLQITFIQKETFRQPPCSPDAFVY